MTTETDTDTVQDTQIAVVSPILARLIDDARARKQLREEEEARAKEEAAKREQANKLARLRELLLNALGTEFVDNALRPTFRFGIDYPRSRFQAIAPEATIALTSDVTIGAYIDETTYTSPYSLPRTEERPRFEVRNEVGLHPSLYLLPDDDQTKNQEKLLEWLGSVLDALTRRRPRQMESGDDLPF